MNILGVGGAEFLAIFLIMIVVAGPKRMIHWSYILGTYVSKMRRMWEEAAAMLQKEFDEAGMDIQVPRDIPTRQSLNREAQKLTNPITRPLDEVLEETKAAAAIPKENGRPTYQSKVTRSTPAETNSKPAEQPDLGSWSKGNGSQVDSNLGTWSNPKDKED
ncbi:MAG: hypothetical protein H6672_01975 [Anaerolineaceae bacterium]|nr:hypothetical protein [Anaerolineaceae bacterium]